MTFTDFINSIINSFLNVFNFIISIFDLIISNNWIKLIIFITLVYFVIDFFSEIIDLIFNIFSMKKANSKQKTTTKTNLDIE